MNVPMGNCASYIRQWTHGRMWCIYPSRYMLMNCVRNTHLIKHEHRYGTGDIYMYYVYINLFIRQGMFHRWPPSLN